MRVAVGLALWAAAHTAWIVADGLVDDVRPADAAVVLGSRVEPSGEPCDRLAARLDRALELYRAGTVGLVIVSGGRGPEGHEEADVMARYLLERGVAPERVVADRGGATTFDTARNTAAILRARGLRSAVVVSTYFHLTRAKLALRRAGVEDVSSAAARFDPSVREPWSLLREVVGFYVYLLRPSG